ncbi:MAG: A/G-specific adenine glycosylase [Nocardioidaceae bacterium]
MESLQEAVVGWYAANARDLPWRSPAATPWAVLVSEFMLQQTPVARVLPAYERWLADWPTPGALAATSTGAAIRAWGRLGYPRRAVRLHAAATAIVERHGGAVPSSYPELLALPGVGTYTASAVASFGFGRRHAVLDTNVRRVLTRLLDGVAFPPPAPGRAERAAAERLLPLDGRAAAVWSVGVMELGALVCTAGSPACERCPVAARCAWLAAGRPAYDGPPRPVQGYAGTDRQCRGRLLAILRDSEGPVRHDRLEAAWSPAAQRDRCLASLLEDGLATRVSDSPATYALP